MSNPFGYPPYSETVGYDNTPIQETTVSNTTTTKTASTIWTGAFWKGAGERAIKTFVQSFAAVALVNGVGTTLGVSQVHWVADASIAVVATLASLATSVGSVDFTAGK